MRPHTGTPGLLGSRPPTQAYHAAPTYSPYGALPQQLYHAVPPSTPPMYAPPPAPTAPSASTPSRDQAEFLQAMNHFAAQGNSGTDWIFDSGASCHMSASSNMLSSCTPSSSFSSITLADGSSIPIYCVGQAHLPSSTKPLLLRDVLVAPALIKNLISVRQFTRDNFVFAEFDPFGLSVKDYLTKEEIARFSSFGDLNSLHGVPTTAPPVFMVASVDRWHRRLGHHHSAILSSILSDFSTPCNRDTHDSSVCVLSTRKTCASSF